MSRILLDKDPYTGISQYHEYDHITDTSTFVSEGDAEPALELNRRIKNEIDVDKGIKQDWWFYASIPAIFQVKLLAEKGIDVYKKEHGARLSKVLEDPEYSHLKLTRKKHLIKSHD